MHKQHGLTLIEILIALAIISIALTAIIKTTSQTIRETRYLQDKTLATWVANYAAAQVRLKLIKVNDDEALKNHTQMLNEDWYYQINIDETPNKHIKKILVNVYKNESDAAAVVHIESYLYA